ncbi:MAG: phosphocarrier protein Chr [Clostridiales bacterium]|nr:phosphocarrier protein Chr [Clostridiales bacterium]
MNRDRVIRLVTAANSFSANVLLESQGAIINGKSMLGLLSITEDTGRDYTLVISGEDEAEALDRLAAMLEEVWP